ncbi:unnamed protein product, partial [Symbiodinium sp. KB8]
PSAPLPEASGWSHAENIGMTSFLEAFAFAAARRKGTAEVDPLGGVPPYATAYTMNTSTGRLTAGPLEGVARDPDAAIGVAGEQATSARKAWEEWRWKLPYGIGGRVKRGPPAPYTSTMLSEVAGLDGRHMVEAEAAVEEEMQTSTAPSEEAKEAENDLDNKRKTVPQSSRAMATARWRARVRAKKLAHIAAEAAKQQAAIADDDFGFNSPEFAAEFEEEDNALYSGSNSRIYRPAWVDALEIEPEIRGNLVASMIEEQEAGPLPEGFTTMKSNVRMK